MRSMQVCIGMYIVRAGDSDIRAKALWVKMQIQPIPIPLSPLSSFTERVDAEAQSILRLA